MAGKEAFYNLVGDFFVFCIIAILIIVIYFLCKEIDEERKKNKRLKQAYSRLLNSTKYEVVTRGNWTGYDLEKNN